MSNRFIVKSALAMPLMVQYVRRNHYQDKDQSECAGEEGRKAICVLDPQPNQTAYGVVKFDQPNFYSKCKITGDFKGLTPGLHGFHIHQFGNLT